MSYHVYTTEGIILKRKSSGEQNIVLYILTRDLGLIIASVRSTRTPKSKLRGLVEEYTQGYFSLVKGKNGWKLTNVSDTRNLFFEALEYSRKTIVQVSSILLKMIQGETPQKEVFNSVLSGLNFLVFAKKDEVFLGEMLIVLRIMMMLGYVENSMDIKKFFLDDSFDSKLLKEIEKDKFKVVTVINKAIKESQL